MTLSVKTTQKQSLMWKTKKMIQQQPNMIQGKQSRKVKYDEDGVENNAGRINNDYEN